MSPIYDGNKAGFSCVVNMLFCTKTLSVILQ